MSFGLNDTAGRVWIVTLLRLYVYILKLKLKDQASVGSGSSKRGGDPMDSKQMLMVLEHYCRKIAPTNDDIKVTRIADWKTMFVEQSGERGQAVMLTEYKVDGATYWAGFSSRSQTVYISLAA